MKKLLTLILTLAVTTLTHAETPEQEVYSWKLWVIGHLSHTIDQVENGQTVSNNLLADIVKEAKKRYSDDQLARGQFVQFGVLYSTKLMKELDEIAEMESERRGGLDAAQVRHLYRTILAAMAETTMAELG